ncbi:MAG: tRNA threonylcarbamoyladenosine biosynthesis protein TsaB [Arenicella sp.]|jgi:tRNA threonylcarbamoyladenosine biosynthesis protein TsaB
MILSIETSTPVCSVALHRENELLGSYELHTEKSHSTALTQMIENLLKLTKISAKELKAVAVSKGPGSYTGLRIGTSTAKGLCYGLDIPLISINTLESMAFGVSQFFANSNSLICPMIDARRMEVYTAHYSANLDEQKPVYAKIIDENSFSEELGVNKVVIFGNGAKKCLSAIEHKNLIFLDGIVPHAKQIGEIAQTKFEQEEFADLAYFEPFYLKDFIAGKPKRSPLFL